MRGLHTAIIDEASVLVDEAVTPLLISRPQANAAAGGLRNRAFHCRGVGAGPGFRGR